MGIEIKVLGPDDANILTRVAPEVFDRGVNPNWTAEFLNDPRHHLVVAINEGVVVGFVSAVDYIHPDKPRELWINEVGVSPTHQGHGLGKRLMDEMLKVARSRGCVEVWVLTDRSNVPAMRLYTSAGGMEKSPDSVMFEFDLK